MNPDDPRTKFNINNFDTPNLSDAPSWGQIVDVDAETLAAGSVVKQWSRGLVDVHLNRYATAPLNYCLNIRREFSSGNSASGSGNAVWCKITTGSGNAAYSYEIDGAPLPPAYGVGHDFSIPMQGINIPICGERLTVTLFGQGDTFVPPPGRVDKIVAWVSRGFPNEYFVTKTGFRSGGTNNPVTIPQNAVDFSAFGFNQVGNRINVQIRFGIAFGTIVVPTPVSGETYNIVAGDNQNSLAIHPQALTIYDVTAPPPAVFQTILYKFRCIA